jgi:hypothetical protein
MQHKKLQQNCEPTTIDGLLTNKDMDPWVNMLNLVVSLCNFLYGGSIFLSQEQHTLCILLVTHSLDLMTVLMSISSVQDNAFIKKNSMSSNNIRQLSYPSQLFSWQLIPSGKVLKSIRKKMSRKVKFPWMFPDGCYRRQRFSRWFSFSVRGEFPCQLHTVREDSNFPYQQQHHQKRSKVSLSANKR